MLRSLVVLLLAAPALLPVSAATLPERIGAFTRGEEKEVPLADRPVWEEFGLDATAMADYAGPEGKFTLTVIRMKDSTGAMAAFRAGRPAGSQPSKFDKLAAETPQTLFLAFGNYVFQYDGRRPTVAEFEELLARLPKLQNFALPTLPGFAPAKGLVPGSDRFILGPSSLARFAPPIPPGTAAFSTGAEGILGRYRSPAGELSLAIFAYPTPHIARERVPEFQKIAGVVVKRSGPLVAVVLPPANADEAERLLAEVRYEANITLNQKISGPGDNAGVLMLSIFTLAGILMANALAAGIAMGGFRVLWRKITGHEIAEDALIVLNLNEK